MTEWLWFKAKMGTPPNKFAKRYKDYGGRGIEVCIKWRNSFEDFARDILVEIGECPEGKSLDRINNDGNYEPGNLKWSTPKEQANNRRNNV